jgi:hypothetical protein
MVSYQDFIDNIINTRGRFSCGNEYHERHHIVPKCMNGTDNEENLIDLFAREHFEAHRLLALENPENDSLIYGWTMMAFVKDGNQQRYVLTAEEYENARIALSMVASERYIGENNPFYGKRHTKETREKMRKSSEQRWSRPEEKEKARKAKANMSQETRQKMSESALKRFENPENHPLYGWTPSDETRKKMSDSAKARCTEEWKQSMRENDRCKHIICIETNKWYISIREANRQTGIHRYQISQSVKSNGKIPAGKGENGEYLHWISAELLDSNNGNTNTQLYLTF